MVKRTYEVILYFPETKFQHRYFIESIDFEAVSNIAQEEAQIYIEDAGKFARVVSIIDVTGDWK